MLQRSNYKCPRRRRPKEREWEKKNWDNLGKFLTIISSSTKSQVQEPQRVPNRINPRGNTPRHIIIRLPISSSFIWLGRFLSYSFTWWIFIWLFMLFRLLCLGWPFGRLDFCGSSQLWSPLLWVGFDQWLFKVSWLGELVSVISWVELDVFFLDCNGMSSS